MTNSTTAKAVQAIDNVPSSYIKKNLEKFGTVGGLHIGYSACNQAHYLYWYESLLGCGELGEMIDRFLEYLPSDFSYQFDGASYNIFNAKQQLVASLQKH